MKKIILSLLVAISAVWMPSTARAEGFGNWVGGVWNDAKKTFTDPEEYDLYIPVYTWHNRLTYDDVSKYNENPWGAGFGVARKDANGNEDRLFFMAFKDSNYYMQTAFGYGWMKNFWESDNRNWKLEAGWALTLLQRHEYSYIPVPLPLPMAGITYKNVALEGAYVVGGQNDGNVLFVLARYRF